MEGEGGGSADQWEGCQAGFPLWGSGGGSHHYLSCRGQRGKIGSVYPEVILLLITHRYKPPSYIYWTFCPAAAGSNGALDDQPYLKRKVILIGVTWIRCLNATENPK